MIAFTADRMALHRPGPLHPEHPERLAAARRGLEGLVTWREARPAPVEALVRTHAEPWVHQVRALRGRSMALDPDTRLSPASVDAAELAAGSAVDLVDALIDGDSSVGWALVRPPGHHAEASRAMGFCVFNNVAVAAEHALAVRGVERVAVVDWDVHHGNGTQHLFESRSDVLFFSSHQFGAGFYPGTGGAGETGREGGAGFTINAPLRPGAGDREITAALMERFDRACRDFGPDLILVSAGFDAHEHDPVGGLRVSEAGFRELALRVADLADHAGAPLGLVLEGGYDLGALERSVRAVAVALGPEGRTG